VCWPSASAHAWPCIYCNSAVDVGPHAYLYEAAHAQVLLDDDVVHGSHDEPDLHRVGGACEVGVDLLRWVLVEADQ